jgi:hypothetical protein
MVTVPPSPEEQPTPPHSPRRSRGWGPSVPRSPPVPGAGCFPWRSAAPPPRPAPARSPPPRPAPPRADRRTQEPLPAGIPRWEAAAALEEGEGEGEGPGGAGKEGEETSLPRAPNPPLGPSATPRGLGVPGGPQAREGGI